MGKRDLNVTPPAPEGAPGEVRLLKAGRFALQPDVWIVDGENGGRIWKTWGRRPWLERLLFGRWLAQREGRIMRRLEGLEGFPRLISHPHPWTIEMSLLDAEPVPDTKQPGGLTPKYFDNLWEMIAAMHARGINHGDLRRKNLLRAPADHSMPRIVDFTQCLYFRLPVGGVRGWLFREAVRIDRVTFLKLKRWYLGGAQMTEEETRDMQAVPWHLRAGRVIRKRVYRPYKYWRRGEKLKAKRKKN